MKGVDCVCRWKSGSPYLDQNDDFPASQLNDRVIPAVNQVAEQKNEIPIAPALEAPEHNFLSDINYWAFSQQGEKHIKDTTPCQDRCAIKSINGADIVVAAIADGVGSCLLSDHGAYTAVNTAVDFIESALIEELKNNYDEFKLNDAYTGDLLRKAMLRSYSEVDKRAAEMEQLLYSFQSTLTIAVYEGNTLYFSHAGDDGIVALKDNGILALVTDRHKGEDANSVFPLQSMKTWQFGKVEGVVAFIMATDGVLDAFVRGAVENNRIYYPFIEPIITLSPQIADDVKKICSSYYELLAGSEYRASVTDDLTMVVVTDHGKLRHTCIPYFSIEEWNAETSRHNARVFAALYPELTNQKKEIGDSAIEADEWVGSDCRNYNDIDTPATQSYSKQKNLDTRADISFKIYEQKAEGARELERSKSVKTTENDSVMLSSRENNCSGMSKEEDEFEPSDAKSKKKTRLSKALFGKKRKKR